MVDFDHKEVLIPNKSFITDRVVNWTLSSETTRLLLKVGLAQESDVAAAQRIMLEAVRRNPDVLAEPAAVGLPRGPRRGLARFRDPRVRRVV